MNPSSSLFQEANKFILPETKLFDFFDYLAGQKIQIQEDKPLSQQLKITFRHIDSIPKKLYTNRKFDSKQQQFKPIFLREFNDDLKQDAYPNQQLEKNNQEAKQYPKSTEKRFQGARKMQNQGGIFSTTQRKKIGLNSLSTNRTQSDLKNKFQNLTDS